MVSGVWKIDAHGTLTHLRGPGFHWMTLDADDRFAAARLPSGSDGDIARIGTSPTLLLGSDFPLAVGRDGNLYFPSHRAGRPLQLLRLLPTGQTSIVATLPASSAGRPVRELNGLAAGPDGSLYYTENDAIRRISRAGTVSTVVEHIEVAGCTSTPRGQKRDPLLRGLDVDAGGTIYVAATVCGSVLRVSPAGRVSVMPQVANPWPATGVALSGNDLYVLEFQNAESDDRRAMLPRVRKIAADGSTTVVATVTRH
jgi:sugar lactone lactonase YvrE